MSDATTPPLEEELRPHSGPGEEYRRLARKEGINLAYTMDVLRRRGGRPDEDMATLRKSIDVSLAQIDTLNSIAESEESAAASAAALKIAEAMRESSDALVKWTKVMVWVVIVQAIAAVAQVIGALCRGTS